MEANSCKKKKGHDLILLLVRHQNECICTLSCFFSSINEANSDIKKCLQQVMLNA